MVKKHLTLRLEGCQCGGFVSNQWQASLHHTVHVYHTPAILGAQSPGRGTNKTAGCAVVALRQRFLSSLGSFASASVEFLGLALGSAVLETVGAYAFLRKWQLRWSLLCCECFVCAWRQISPYPIVKVYILRYTHTCTHFSCVYLGVYRIISWSP